MFLCEIIVYCYWIYLTIRVNFESYCSWITLGYRFMKLNTVYAIIFLLGYVELLL